MVVVPAYQDFQPEYAPYLYKLRGKEHFHTVLNHPMTGKVKKHHVLIVGVDDMVHRAQPTVIFLDHIKLNYNWQLYLINHSHIQNLLL